MNPKRQISASAAKVLIRDGWKCMISAQLELALFEGQEPGWAFWAIPASNLVEAVILFPSYSHLVDTDIDTGVSFQAKQIRRFLGLTHSP